MSLAVHYMIGLIMDTMEASCIYDALHLQRRGSLLPPKITLYDRVHGVSNAKSFFFGGGGLNYPFKVLVPNTCQYNPPGADWPSNTKLHLSSSAGLVLGPIISQYNALSYVME